MPLIQSGDGLQAAPLGERDNARVSGAERKICVSSYELGGPLTILGGQRQYLVRPVDRVFKEPRFSF